MADSKSDPAFVPCTFSPADATSTVHLHFLTDCSCSVCAQAVERPFQLRAFEKIMIWYATAGAVGARVESNFKSNALVLVLVLASFVSAAMRGGLSCALTRLG